MGEAFPVSEKNYHLRRKDDLELPIYRYMRLSPFLQILFDKKMEVHRRYCFTDWREQEPFIHCGFSFGHLYPAGEKVPEVLHRRWEEEDKEKARRSALIPVSCWTTNREDQYLRWKAYGTGLLTVRIGTTVGKILQSMEGYLYPIYAGKVDYKEKMIPSPDYGKLFWKHPTYQCEEEFRFCFFDESEREAMRSAIAVGLSSTDFIDSVMIHSFVDNGLALDIRDMIRRILPQTPVEKSALIEVERRK